MWSTVTPAVPNASSARALIAAAPSVLPSTSPAVSTRATEVSSEDHANTACRTGWPLASRASAARRRVSPWVTEAAAGATVTERATCITASHPLPEAAPAVAVTDVPPFPFAVATPAASIVATAVSPLAHNTSASGIGRPIWSKTSGAKGVVSASAVSNALSGVTATVVGTGLAMLTATACSAARPSGSEAVTTTTALPWAVPDTSRVSPDTVAPATPASEVAAS